MDWLQSTRDGTSRVSVPAYQYSYPIMSYAVGCSLEPDLEQEVEGHGEDTLREMSHTESQLQYQAEEQLWQQRQHMLLHQQRQRPEQSEVLMCEVWLPSCVIQQSRYVHFTLP